MAIILRLDRVMADRKISLNELAERVLSFLLIIKLPGNHLLPGSFLSVVFF